MIPEPKSRSALSVGLDWAARITTIGLEFALPAFLGFGLDRWWNTSPWMTIVGAFLGLGMGMWQVLRLAHEPPAPPRPKTSVKTEPPEGVKRSGPSS